MARPATPSDNTDDIQKGAQPWETPERRARPSCDKYAEIVWCERVELRASVWMLAGCQQRERRALGALGVRRGQHYFVCQPVCDGVGAPSGERFRKSKHVAKKFVLEYGDTNNRPPFVAQIPLRHDHLLSKQQKKQGTRMVLLFVLLQKPRDRHSVPNTSHRIPGTPFKLRRITGASGRCSYIDAVFDGSFLKPTGGRLGLIYLT